VSHVAVDSKDRVYFYQRKDPPVLVFDGDGMFLTGWGSQRLRDDVKRKPARERVADDLGAPVRGAVVDEYDVRIESAARHRFDESLDRLSQMRRLVVGHDDAERRLTTARARAQHPRHTLLAST
jgi:hypothetical protein